MTWAEFEEAREQRRKDRVQAEAAARESVDEALYRFLAAKGGRWEFPSEKSEEWDQLVARPCTYTQLVEAVQRLSQRALIGWEFKAGGSVFVHWIWD